MATSDESALQSMSEWYHPGTGCVYIVVGIAQCSTNGPREDKERSVVYWTKRYRALRYRQIDEFLDGRFLPVSVDGRVRLPSGVLQLEGY